MEEVSWNITMVTDIKDFGEMEWEMDKVHISITTEISIMDYG